MSVITSLGEASSRDRVVDVHGQSYRLREFVGAAPLRGTYVEGTACLTSVVYGGACTFNTQCITTDSACTDDACLCSESDYHRASDDSCQPSKYLKVLVPFVMFPLLRTYVL